MRAMSDIISFFIFFFVRLIHNEADPGNQAPSSICLLDNLSTRLLVYIMTIQPTPL